MRWLSECAEALVGKLRANAGREPVYDVVVVGSGYGGSVAACRLARAGLKVCVLERGEERLPGEFPNDVAHLPGHVRIERADRPGTIGRRDGMFDFRAFGDVTVLVGNALGGGSQINANVAMRADPRLFSEREWPEALRRDYDPLDPYYTRVEEMLGARPYPHPAPKAEELARLAGPITEHIRRNAWASDTVPEARCYRLPLSVTYRDGPNAVGITQRACTGCGDCVTGCNVGAKNTLAMNYLPEAKRYGAEIFTGATVVAVKPDSPEGRTTVYFVYSDEDWSQEFAENRPEAKQLLENAGANGIDAITAPVVILAAGTLGSTEILLRSRQLGLARFSPRLGTGFSGNGGSLGFGYDQDRPVNAIGWGSDPRRYATPGRPDDPPAPGPAIVATLDMRPGLPVREGVLIQDGIVPGAAAHIGHELLATSATLNALGSWRMRRDAADADPLALDDDALRRTQVYLGMGHDEAAGTMRLKHGRIVVDWPAAARQAGAERADEYLQLVEKAVGASYVPSPFRRPLPKGLTSILSGPRLEGTAVEVHPLGGCPMGDDVERGVVDDLGAVYSGETPRSTYRSLYVWDGSICPGSLGVNPYLTIAALAERAAERLIVREKADADAKAAAAPLEAPAFPVRKPFENPGGARTALVFKETFRGELEWPGAPGGPAPVALELRWRVPDLIAFLKHPKHRIATEGEDGGSLDATMRGALRASALGDAPLEVTGGSVEFLVREPSTRVARTVRAIGAWFRKRGRDEILRHWRERRAGKQSRINVAQYALDLLRLANHAGERRKMFYTVRLRSRDGARYTLSGTKTVEFGVGSNPWLSLLDLHVELRRDDDAARLAHGVVRMDLIALADDDVPQISRMTDLPNGLLALASFPLLLLRVLLKTHIWDFRAPDYPTRTLRAPLPEQRPLIVERVASPRSGGAPYLYPEYHWIDVPGGAAHGSGKIELLLTRFAPPDGNAHRTPVILLPGFGQSARAFVAEPLEEDLVRHLLKHGFEAWLFDYRTSTALPSSREQHTLDDVARYDIPAAISRIREVLEADGRGEVKVMAVGHCMGAASLAMSLLSGELPGTALKAVVLSQVPPFVVGGLYSQFRRRLAAFLRDVAGVGHVNIAADDGASAWEVILDRLLGTLPVADAPCPGEHDRAAPRNDIATCKRIFGIVGPNYLHRNVTRTHHLMHHYFGWATLAVFNQIGKFFEYERLVSAEGLKNYVTDANLFAHMSMPVAFLHGRKNALFHYESSVRSCAQFIRVNDPQATPPSMEETRPTSGSKRYPLFLIEDYGHFDCLIGDRAHQDVFPKISRFLAAHLGDDAPRVKA